jgi:hypothetical protein
MLTKGLGEELPYTLPGASSGHVCIEDLEALLVQREIRDLYGPQELEVPIHSE